MKKIISTVLTLCLLISPFAIFDMSASAASYNVNNALNYAKAHWSDGAGQCAEFVSKCLTAGGISMNHVGTGNLSRALLNNGYATKYKITKFSNNRIKFSDYSGKISVGDVLGTYCTVCGQYTHVMLVNNKDGFVSYYAWNRCKNNATYYNNSYKCNNNSKHSPIETHVLHINTSTTENVVVKKPTLSLTSYPTSIKKGASYGLRGSVCANGAKTTVKTTVINSKGKTVLSTSDTVSASSTGNIQNMNANKKIAFGSLAKGTYTLKIVATNSKGSSTFSKSFKVEESIGKPILNVTSYPTSIKKGASYGLRGSVCANGAKTTVKTTVINSKGKTVLSTSDTVSASSTGNIQNMNANKKIAFGSLAKGTYTLKIVATNSKGSSTFSKSFKIK